MAEKSPAFLFFVDDWLNDEKVTLMSSAECGVYINLLAHAWREGSLSPDPAVLARLVREPLPTFKKLWARVSACFTARPDGRLVNPRQEKERAIEAERRERRSHSSRKAAEARWANGVPPGSDEHADRMRDASEGHANRTPTAVPEQSGGNADGMRKNANTTTTKEQDKTVVVGVTPARKRSATEVAEDLAGWAFDRATEVGVMPPGVRRDHAVAADREATERLLLQADEALIRQRWERVIDDVKVGHLQRKDDISLRFLLRLWSKIEAHERRVLSQNHRQKGQAEDAPAFDYNALIGLTGGAN